MNSNRSNLSQSWPARVAAILLFIAGIIHLVIVPDHFEHAPAHGIFMGIIGVVEMMWGVTFWMKPSNRLAKIGLMISVSCITLWGITRILPAPYGQGPEEVDAAGMITKVLEGITVLLLIWIVNRTLPSPQNVYSGWRAVISVILIAVLLGFGIYEAARASEPLFPRLAGSEIHEPEEHEHQNMLPTGASVNLWLVGL